MSLVLGPIHHWMHGKIKTSEAREEAIVSAFKEKYGEEADAVLKQSYEKFPQSDKSKPLEELLANKSIHQGIQSLIIEAETREAGIVAAFCEKFEDAAKVAADAAHSHGIQCGTEAVGAKNLSREDRNNTSKIFEVLGDYHCDGMPCDRGAQAIEESAERTVWDHENCIHEPYWNNAGADFLTMCDIVNKWIAGFCEGINSQSVYKREKAIASGDTTCLSTLELKI